MADEPLHEIQLNGKQLVFLFMSATVVAVVIFLCGVMVGRGVRAPRLDRVEAAVDETVDPTASLAPVAPLTTTSDSAPATAQETLTYPSRLGSAAPPEETLKEPSAPSTAPAVPAAQAPAPTTPAAPASTSVPKAAAVPEPAGSGFVVQVAATRERREADAIAQRLSGKGYPAFVTTPASGPRMFRVRVGKYKDRREAETIASRLEREEQFKPWVTR
jgi:cell division septation protein DedD